MQYLTAGLIIDTYYNYIIFAVSVVLFCIQSSKTRHEQKHTVNWLISISNRFYRVLFSGSIIIKENRENKEYNNISNDKLDIITLISRYILNFIQIYIFPQYKNPENLISRFSLPILTKSLLLFPIYALKSAKKKDTNHIKYGDFKRLSCSHSFFNSEMKTQR